MRRNPVVRLARDHPGQIGEVLARVREDGIDLLARAVDENVGRRVVRLRQRVDPGRLQEGDCLRRAAALGLETADAEHDAESRRLRRHVAVRRVAVVIRRQQQELAALALVTAGRADTHDLALPQVGDAAEQHRRRFDDHRAIPVEVDGAPGRRRFPVAGEQQRCAVHQVFPQHHLVRRSAFCLGDPFPDAIPGDAVHLHQVGLDRAVEQQRIAQNRAAVSPVG